MEDADEGYGDPHEEEESEGEDVQLKEEDVGVSLGTTKGKCIMHGGPSFATATRKRRCASISSVSRGRGRSHGRTGGGRVPTMRSSNMSDRPSIGYLYESMDRANEAIRDNMKGKKKLYMPIWKIIDERLSEQLHRPLYAVAYYLNPTIRAGVDSFSSARRRRLTGASCRRPIVRRLVPPRRIERSSSPVASTSARNTSTARATTSVACCCPSLHICSSPSAARRVVFSCRRTVARLLPSSPTDAIVRRCRLPPPVASCCSPGVFSASCRSSDVALLRRLLVRLVCRRLPLSPAAC
ncbi:hypothetical protein EJ110_NYTH57559 [Nymphaea thermarum]|nr:hypothetical protein EJ110_NYTH57559 [Nymphaea thermarum]